MAGAETVFRKEIATMASVVVLSVDIQSTLTSRRR
jgi:hypothetical protein